VSDWQKSLCSALSCSGVIWEEATETTITRQARQMLKHTLLYDAGVAPAAGGTREDGNHNTAAAADAAPLQLPLPCTKVVKKVGVSVNLAVWHQPIPV
jgi:hypothetical protein